MRFGIVLAALAVVCGASAEARPQTLLDAMGITRVTVGYLRPSASLEGAGRIVVRTKRCTLSRAGGEAVLQVILSGRNVNSEIGDSISYSGDPRVGSAYLLRFERRGKEPILAAIGRSHRAAKGVRVIQFNGDYVEIAAEKLAIVERIALKPGCGVRVRR